MLQLLFIIIISQFPIKHALFSLSNSNVIKLISDSDLANHYAYNGTDLDDVNCTLTINGNETDCNQHCVGGLNKLHMYYILLVCCSYSLWWLLHSMYVCHVFRLYSILLLDHSVSWICKVLQIIATVMRHLGTFLWG